MTILGYNYQEIRRVGRNFNNFYKIAFPSLTILVQQGDRSVKGEYKRRIKKLDGGKILRFL